MKRYLVFRGDTYYPDGGWRDFFGSFDDREVAEGWAKVETSQTERLCRCGHVIDGQTGVTIARFGQHLGE